jgi:hypothetical protein
MGPLCRPLDQSCNHLRLLYLRGATQPGVIRISVIVWFLGFYIQEIWLLMLTKYHAIMKRSEASAGCILQLFCNLSGISVFDS